MPRTFLHVAHGKVVNASAWDGEADYTPPEGHTLIEKPTEPEGVWIGWTHDAETNVFSPPPDAGDG